MDELQTKLSGAYGVKHPLVGVVKNSLIFPIHHFCRIFRCRIDLPILGVVLPEDGPESKTIGNSTNAVIDVTKGGLRGRTERSVTLAKKKEAIIPSNMLA
jgi:hypothetical protein